MIIRGRTLAEGDIAILGHYENGKPVPRLITTVDTIEKHTDRFTFHVLNGAWVGEWQSNMAWVLRHPEEAQVTHVFLAYDPKADEATRFWDYDDWFWQADHDLNASKARIAYEKALAYTYPYRKPFMHLAEALRASWATFLSYYKAPPSKPKSKDWEPSEFNNSMF